MSDDRPGPPKTGADWLRRLFRPAPVTKEAPPAAAFELIGSYYDQLMRGVPYREWVDYVEALLVRSGARPKRVLDLACGTGKVGAEMARRGHRCVGVDLSEGMVRVATQEGRLSAAVQDARALGLRADTFDLVVSLYDSLNYILEPTELLACFRGVRHCLAKRGLFIFDLNTIRALALELFTQNNLRSRDPLLYSWKSHWDPATGICSVHMWFKWCVPGEEREFVEVHKQRGYEDEEIRELLRDAGLRLDAVYDGYTFNPLTDRSTRAFYVAHR